MRFKEHVKAVGQALEEVQEKMSAKEKMKKGLYNSKHMDPVGKADADIDNDGDVDKSDKYLHNRRKAISKNIKKNKGETGVMNPKMKTTSKEKGSEMEAKESKDLNKDNAEKAVNHDCASHVEHSEWGPGICIPEEHTIVETSEGQGYVTHYDVQFLHGVEKDVPVAEMKVIKSSSHGHMKKKKDEAMKMPRTIPAKIMPGKPVGKQGGPNSFKGMKPIPMSKAKESTDQGIYGIRNALRAVLEGDRSAHYKGATKPEDYDEKDKNSKGAMDMKKTAKDAETVDKLPKAFDDISKAGRAGPSQKMRNKDNNMGDKKVVNPVQDASKQGSFKEMVNAISKAHQLMYEKKKPGEKNWTGFKHIKNAKTHDTSGTHDGVFHSGFPKGQKAHPKVLAAAKKVGHSDHHIDHMKLKDGHELHTHAHDDGNFVHIHHIHNGEHKGTYKYNTPHTERDYHPGEGAIKKALKHAPPHVIKTASTHLNNKEDDLHRD